MDMEVAKAIGMAIAMWVGGFTPALAIGFIGKAAAEAVGRNPEASWKIFGLSLTIAALAEAVAIYSLVIAIMIKGL